MSDPIDRDIDSEPKGTGPYAVLKIADFRNFISARFCVTLGIQIQGIVVLYQVYELTGDLMAIGWVGLAEAVPSIVVSFFSGHVADFVDRKKIIVCCLISLMLCSVGLLYFSMEPALLLSYGAIPIYSVIFVSGVARGFLTPANFSLMPQLVPREQFKRAVTVNSTTWEVAAIAGPAIGGLLFGVFGLQAAYAVDAALMVGGVIFVTGVANKPLPLQTDDAHWLDKLFAGFRFVFTNKVVLAAISLDLFAVLFGGAAALIPAFAKDILHVGPFAGGVLRAAPSIGALFIAFVLLHNPIRRNMGRTLFWCVAGFGVCMIGFGLSTSFWLSLALLIASGGFDCVSVIVRLTVLQTLTPEHMKGRVSAVNNIFVGSSNEIGAAESGAVANAMGAGPSVVFGGLMTLVVVGTIAWLAKSLRRLQNVS